MNAANKKYSHHLGAGGYKKSVKKWQKMEQDLIDRGIRPTTWDWPDRSKWWLFANGVTLNQLDGSLVVPEHMQEVSRDLVAAIDETQQGTFHPQRENDELTRALKNPEHPGRARGIGVVPWKVAWAGDPSYKTHRKSKAEQEEKLRAIEEKMNKKVASLESQMDARVNEAVQLALIQRGTAGSHPDVVISPASQRRSSCASTAAPDVQAEQQPQIEPTAVDDQRYPVDDVTMPTPCELHVRARNISIHVAYGSALPLNPSTTIHGRPIPPGYTSVTVEQIVGNNEDLELDFVGGDGEKTLGDALHGVVLWRKADIKLTASTTAPVQTDRPSPRPTSPPSPLPPPSPPSPPAQRATSTPTPPTLEKGKKKTASLPAAGPSKKK